eukprot:gene12617-12747_t
MASNSSLHTTISELDNQQARIAGLSTLSKGAVSNPRGSSLRVRSGRSTMGLSAGMQNGQQQGSNAASLVESPYGSPVLSKVQQNIAVKLEKARAQSAKPVLKRQKLSLISVKQLNSQVYKIDGSESRELQQKHGFRTVPMFLFYYHGKLVYAGNSIRTKDEFKEGVFQALAAGRRGTFLPDHLSFQGNDMTVLNSITHNMSLLNPSR